MPKKKTEEILDIVDNVKNEVAKKRVPNPTGRGSIFVPEVEKGDNSRYLKHAMKLYNLPVINIEDPKQVEERIEWYFNHCIDNDMKPTVSGLALSIGVDRTTLWNWKTGKVRNTTHLNLVKKAYDILEALWEDYMQNGKINPVSGIFLGKNHFGYRDQQDIIVEPKNPLGEEINADIVQKEYLEEQNLLNLLNDTKNK